MLEYFDALDKSLLIWINNHSSGILDNIMLFASAKFTWVPFYILLVLYIIYDFRKQSVLILVFIAVTITLSDQTSVHLFKNVFQRLRPCHQEELLDKLRLIAGCGGKYGFVSSHAANSFSVATFVNLLFKKRWVTVIMVLWAVLIGYSRIYLAAHFPFDVVAGAILGVVAGYIVFSLYLPVSKTVYKN
jgi:undecaprenyl-diphosphatase